MTESVSIMTPSPYPLWKQCLDLCMMPLMVAMQWTVKESLQRTHFWNNHKLSSSEVVLLQEKLMVSHPGDREAGMSRKFGLPVFHMPAWGGWKHYVVLEPSAYNHHWYVGWKTSSHTAGVSLIPLKGPVKMLVGGEQTSWFALNAVGDQIAIQAIGGGQLGAGGKFAKLPLR